MTSRTRIERFWTLSEEQMKLFRTGEHMNIRKIIELLGHAYLELKSDYDKHGRVGAESMRVCARHADTAVDALRREADQADELDDYFDEDGQIKLSRHRDRTYEPDIREKEMAELFDDDGKLMLYREEPQ